MALFHAACVSDLIVRSNGGNGIVTGIDSRVVRCTADHNGLHGIVVSNGSIVSDCAANDNDENGIWVAPMSGTPVSGIVSGCVAYSNTKNGIRVDGNTLRGNVLQNWKTSGTSTGNLFTVWTVASPGIPSRWDNIDLGEAP